MRFYCFISSCDRHSLNTIHMWAFPHHYQSSFIFNLFVYRNTDNELILLMNSLKINEQKRCILLSETVKLLSTDDLKGAKPKENRNTFPDIHSMASSQAAYITLLPCTMFRAVNKLIVFRPLIQYADSLSQFTILKTLQTVYCQLQKISFGFFLFYCLQ